MHRRTSRATSSSGRRTCSVPRQRATTSSTSTCSAQSTRSLRKKRARRRSSGATRKSSISRAAPPRASSTCSSTSTSAWRARRSTPTSCCRPLRGTRRMTSPRRTCIRSSTRSRPLSTRSGRPGATGMSSARSRQPSRRSRRKPTSSRMKTSSPCQSATTVRVRRHSQRAASATGARASVSPSPGRRCRASCRSSATTQRRTRSGLRSDRMFRRRWARLR